MADKFNAPAGCTAPRLGAEVRAALGEELPPWSELARHATTCLACALERRVWLRAEKEPASATLTAALLSRVDAAVRGTSE